jgi:hypothetical protein
MAANRTVTHNYIHRIGQMGIGGAASGSVVDHNEIAYNNNNPGAYVVPYWEAGGTKFVRTDGLTISNNFSHHNGGSGLGCDIDCINIVYEYNLIEDNLNNGIMHETSYAAIIRYNTIRRNGTSKHFQYWTEQAGIQIFASRDVEIYGNLLEDNWNGLTALHANRGTGRHGIWELRNFYAHHNTIKSVNITEAGWGRSGLEDAAGDAAFTSMNNRFQNNTYHLGTAANYFMWMHHDRDENYWRSWPETSAIVIK